MKIIGSPVHLALVGRHVYSIRINKYPKALVGRHVHPKGENLRRMNSRTNELPDKSGSKAT